MSFHVIITIVSYSCQLWLEKQLNHNHFQTYWMPPLMCKVECGQLCCSSVRYMISMECKICVLSSKRQKCDAFHQAWIWLHTAEKVHFCPYTSAVNELAICHVSSVNESFADNEVRRSSGMEEEKYKHNLKQEMIFAKAHAVYKSYSLTHTATAGMTKRTF